MAKGKTTVFFCQDCGYESSKWMGQCPGCGGWNTFVEEVIDKSAPAKVRKEAAKAEVVKIADIKTGQEERLTTGLKELDRVLGGGIVKGSLVLVGGDPGIGKSTLLLQVCRNLSKKTDVLYISGEESLKQIKMRASRIGTISGELLFLCETNLDTIMKILHRRPAVFPRSGKQPEF